MIILIVLGTAITVGSMACTLASDPLRELVGLHQRRLSALLDNPRARTRSCLFSKGNQATADGLAQLESPGPLSQAREEQGRRTGPGTDQERRTKTQGLSPL